MKKTRRKTSDAQPMRSKYKFDYRDARPNRFASEMQGSAVAVVLDPDVAEVFDTAASVNRMLRSVITALPESRKESGKRKTRRKAS